MNDSPGPQGIHMNTCLYCIHGSLRLQGPQATKIVLEEMTCLFPYERKQLIKRQPASKSTSQKHSPVLEIQAAPLLENQEKGFWDQGLCLQFNRHLLKFLFWPWALRYITDQQTVVLRQNPAQHLFFANKVLLEHSHACPFTYCLYGCCPTTPSHFNKNIWAIKPKRFTTWSFTDNVCQLLC